MFGELEEKFLLRFEQEKPLPLSTQHTRSVGRVWNASFRRHVSWAEGSICLTHLNKRVGSDCECVCACEPPDLVSISCG